MSLFNGVGTRIAELAEEVISNNARFESLEKLTAGSLGEFKTSLERFDDRLRQVEAGHVREVADLRSQITVLEGRLQTLSEQALHAVAEKVMREAHTAGGADAVAPRPETLRIAAVAQPADRT